MVSYEMCFAFMLMLFWLRYRRSCHRRLLEKRVSIERERRLAARRQEDEAPFNNHVTSPLLNYQAASICLKPPIGGGLGLLRIDVR